MAILSFLQVWFQNRRTKWRKRHAAEMATAKRKQEEAVDGYGDEDQEEDGQQEQDDQQQGQQQVQENKRVKYMEEGGGSHLHHHHHPSQLPQDSTMVGTSAVPSQQPNPSQPTQSQQQQSSALLSQLPAHSGLSLDLDGCPTAPDLQ